MVVVKKVSAKSILDSRKEKTIFVSIQTNVGNFSASSPNGKSKGKSEAKPYKINLDSDIKRINEFKNYFSKDSIEKFSDLRRVEDIVEGHIGANTLFALESAILKALAKERKKQIWQLINPLAKKFPRLVGNCIGGGKHSERQGKKPDFQEFLLIPKTKTIKEAFEKNKKVKQQVVIRLRESDKSFENKLNDENAWSVGLNEKQALDVLKEFKLPLGLDVASSSFYKRKKYHYENPKLDRTIDEQFGYLSNLIKNFGLFYIEVFPDRLIVGDDLIVTNYKRLKKAVEMKSVTAIIVKPNQCGSLLTVEKVCELAKKHDIKLVFSHRSGETQETILADLAFGFQAEFFKCGIEGDVREEKIKRLIEIEKKLKKSK